MNATWNALRQINLFINANFEQGAAPWTTRDNAGIESTGKNGHVSITAMQGGRSHCRPNDRRSG